MLSVAIMAHPKREAFIQELLEKLDRPATVVWDEKQDRWDTGRRAMLAYDPDATHHLVLQDDAVVTRDLVAGVEKALQHTPGDVPVCLYVGKVRPYRALVDEYTRNAENASWLVMAQINWGVGIVVPTKHIDPMVAWCDGQRIPNYDSRMSRWFEDQGISTWYPWPSLVDHRDSPSLVPGRSHGGRVARRFAGADASALDFDWGGDVVTLPHPIPDRFHRPGGSPMLFVCTKYPDYQVPNLRVTFIDGFAEVTNRSAISYLNGVFMKRRGIRPATPEEIEAYAKRNAEPAQEAPPVEPPSPSGNPEGTPASTGEATVPEGTADDVLTWVGDDPERAAAAIEVEQAKAKPRKTLLAKLESIAQA